MGTFVDVNVDVIYDGNFSNLKNNSKPEIRNKE